MELKDTKDTHAKGQSVSFVALDHRALNLLHSQFVILKQVQDDDDSGIQHDALKSTDVPRNFDKETNDIKERLRRTIAEQMLNVKHPLRALSC
jgi:hypothetical protein